MLAAPGTPGQPKEPSKIFRTFVVGRAPLTADQPEMGKGLGPVWVRDIIVAPVILVTEPLIEVRLLNSAIPKLVKHTEYACDEPDAGFGNIYSEFF